MSRDGFIRGSFGDLLESRDERLPNDGTHPLYSLTIKDGVTPKTERYEREFLVTNKESKRYKVIRTGDLVFNPSNLRWGAIATSFIRFPVLVSPIYEVFYPKDDQILDPYFLGVLASSPMLMAKYLSRVEGTLVERTALKKDDFLGIEIEIPPLPEQKKIAEILSGIDKVISIKRQARNDLTATREAICSELMQNGDWSQEETGNLVNHMTNGFVGTATPHYRERGVRYLTSKNIRRDRIDPSKMIYISEEFHMANRKSSLMVGDVLMVQSGHIGTTAVVTNDYKDCNCHALILMRFNQERLDPEYASLYFNSATGKTRLSDIFVGSTVKHVNTGDLRKFRIPVPPLGVQRDIAKRISAIDLLLGKRELQIEKLVILKQAISSDLLSGRKRVSV